MYLIGYSSAFIARQLEQNGMKTVMGSTKWQLTVIDKMLSNEKYMGSTLLQKTYTVDFLTKQRAKNNGELSKYYIKHNHQPIIPEEIFYYVQEEKLRRNYLKRQVARRPSQYPISAKLICSGCGSHFYRVIRNKTGKSVSLWRCKSHLITGECCTKIYTLSEKDLHKAIWDAYSRVLYTVPDSNSAELHEIANKMAERKKTILQIIQENVQGFWTWNDLTDYHAKVRNEYYELCDSMFQIFLKSRESIFTPCPFKHIKAHSHYKKYEDELVSLYEERIWTIASNEIIILFKNGSMVREKWDY